MPCYYNLPISGVKNLFEINECDMYGETLVLESLLVPLENMYLLCTATSIAKDSLVFPQQGINLMLEAIE